MIPTSTARGPSVITRGVDDEYMFVHVSSDHVDLPQIICVRRDRDITAHSAGGVTLCYVLGVE